MNATSFKEVNKIYGAGGNPNTDQLPVAISSCESTPGIPFIVSKFKLSADELKKINETGELWLSIMGVSLPPVMPTVYNPFTELDYNPIAI